MKKAIICFILSIMTILSVCAQEFKEHTIERGETIESIAKAYKITVQDIINANPGIKDMFFSGMVIKIPTTTDKSDGKDSGYNQQQYVENVNHETSSDNKNVSFKPSSYADNEPEGLLALKEKASNGLRFLIGYDINTFSNNKDKTDSYITYSSGVWMEANILYRRYLLEGLYAEFGTGIIWGSTSVRIDIEYEGSQKTKYESFAVPINLFAGYTLACSQKFGLDFYTGPQVRIGISNIKKQEGKKYKSDTSNGIGWGIGTTIHIGDFDLGANYIFPLSDNFKVKGLGKTKQNTLMVYLGWTLKL